MTWGQGFAEGDSGVSTPSIAIWNKIVEEKSQCKEVTWVSVKATELYGTVIGIALSIAENENNQNRDRVAALDIVRKAMLDYSSFDQDTQQEA
jgi:hypothetical protein